MYEHTYDELWDDLLEKKKHLWDRHGQRDMTTMIGVIIKGGEFKALPEGAWSIKVGFGATAAHYNLSSPGKVTALLKDLLAEED